MTTSVLAGIRSYFEEPPPRPWLSLARPEQLPPDGPWNIWLLLAGRGWGKTRTGAEWINDQAAKYPGTSWGVVAKTIALARTVCIQEQSGLLQSAQPGEITKHVASLGEVHYANGSKVFAFGAEDPDRLRGYNLAGAWADELAAWDHQETWTEGLVPAVRDRRAHGQIVVTTTPKPRPLIKDLLARTDGSVHVVRGSTFDNAQNLSAGALAQLRSQYEGTRLGRQELYGELLDDIEGALWTYDMIDAYRVTEEPELDRLVIGVDPAVTNNPNSDETGIVAAGSAGRGTDAHFYVLDDRSGRYSVHEWALATVAAYNRCEADAIVCEVNNGQDLVVSNIRNIDRNVPIKKVNASRGKVIRAEPIAALYEQGRVHHVGTLPQLEEQMTTWDAGDPRAKSPDRVDALVWAITDLTGSRGPRIIVYR